MLLYAIYLMNMTTNVRIWKVLNSETHGRTIDKVLQPDLNEETKLNTDTCAKIVFRKKILGIEELRFLLKDMVSSGIGENTYGSKNDLEGREACPSLKDTYEEIDEILFDTLDNLFAKTCFSPSQIDILVVNLSLFSPIPSITSRIINRYKMRE
ncbi:3-ketoacyl-CoA synthase 19 [Lathyrus oleraceus]|uniref:3-ketoacyl-CoA synthase 19 n=1 Tax=Pisum sativum TaxID=3888 RepID=A0A9D5ABK0_PEA|nr:3-ketoacyl-CoA synthase 19 [Pisum sativum]